MGISLMHFCIKRWKAAGQKLVFFILAGWLCLGGQMAGADILVKVAVGGTIHEISDEELNKLPTERYETSTIWTEGIQVLEGPSLRVLLESLGATGGMVELTAINGYFIEMSFEELMADVPILARTRNGTALTRRDKGPLWLVFPYDRGREFQTELIFAQSIWQITDIAVVP
ncbi:MAG TPA: oxidoreductase [Rhodobacteraceae bacterium]|jgi:hypothetical protein|nr:oxidoreductase [Paracoccaceae bacterium]HBV56060.1 oxidoreductase [Paracoccaceae bacterium]